MSAQLILRAGNFYVGFLAVSKTYDKILGKGLSLSLGFIKTILLFGLGVVLIVSDFKSIPTITSKAPWLSTNNGRAAAYVAVTLLGGGSQTIVLAIAAVTVYLGYNGTSYPKPGGSWF
jgi:hypothetical protein